MRLEREKRRPPKPILRVTREDDKGNSKQELRDQVFVPSQEGTGPSSRTPTNMVVSSSTSKELMTNIESIKSLLSKDSSTLPLGFNELTQTSKNLSKARKEFMQLQYQQYEREIEAVNKAKEIFRAQRENL